MTLEIGIIAVAILILLMLSAFFNGSETALTASSRARMHALEQEGNARAALVNRLLKNPERMIGSILIGNTLVDVLAASLATGLGVIMFGPAGIVYATTFVSIMIVIFASVLPKTYALISPDRAALWVAPVMRAIIWGLTPLTVGLEFVIRQLLKLTPSKADDEANILAAHAELRGQIDLQKREGTVVKHDADMLGGVLDLRDLAVLDVMIHRTKMQTLDADAPVKDVIDQVLRSPYTRLPIWKDEPDNIVGVLHSKDLLRALNRSNWDLERIAIMELVQPPWFVPDTTMLKDQLNAFLKRKAQLALVVDEYGVVKGLVTLEDILEEIVGQISDEHDAQDVSLRKQADGSVTVDGTIPIRDLNREMEWDLPDEEATTVAGLVIHEAQTIPEPGQTFTFYGYRFEILRKSRNRITGVRILPLGERRRPAEQRTGAEAGAGGGRP